MAEINYQKEYEKLKVRHELLVDTMDDYLAIIKELRRDRNDLIDIFNMLRPCEICDGHTPEWHFTCLDCNDKERWQCKVITDMLKGVE